jgi:hypothetical protein
MHSPPVDGNFRDESGHAVKHHVIEDYNAHMGSVDNSDRMVNSYGIAWRTWKWTKKLFFHFLDMIILNAYLLHKSRGGKTTHKKISRNPSARFYCTNTRGKYHGQWRFSREAKFICGPTGSTRGETFITLVIQMETKTLSCMFAK